MAPPPTVTFLGALQQEGGPLSGPKTGVLSNTRKWIVQGDTHADEARDFIGKGLLGREQKHKGTQENCSATWLTVSGFIVIGLVSKLSLPHMVLPDGTYITQPRGIPVKILEDW